MSLAVIVGAKERLDAAVRLDADGCGLEKSGPRTKHAGKARWRDARRFDVAGHADAAQPLDASGLRAAFGKTLIVGQLEHTGEDFGKIAAIIGRADRRLVRHGRGRDEIAVADVGAVDAKLGGGAIGETLEHVTGLGPSGAAIGVGWQRIGEHPGHLHEDCRRPVHAGKERAVNRARNRGAEGRDIGAEIGDGFYAQRDKAAVGIKSELGMRQMIAALIVGDEAFAPARHPFDRSAQSPRRPGDDGLLRIMLALITEAAADIGRDHADAAFGEAKLLGDIAPDVMRHLCGRVERQLVARRIGDREHGARLDRGADQPIVDKIEASHMGRALQRLPYRCFVAARPVKADITGRGVMKL